MSESTPLRSGHGHSHHAHDRDHDHDHEDHNGAATTPSILKGFIIGQTVSALRAGLWWVSLAPLTLALFQHKAMVLAAARFVFNLSLLIISPAAGSTVERASARKVLILTTFARLSIWAVLLPLAFVLLQTDWIIHQLPALADTFFLIAFLTLILIDGVVVSFANVVDVDCGGADFVAHQYNVPLSDVLRNKFNSLHVACFEGSMVVFPPVMGGILLGLRSKFVTTDEQHLAIIGSLGVAFLLCGLISITAYLCWIPKMQKDDEDSKIDVNAESSLHSAGELWGSIGEGLRLTWKHRPLFTRLLFLGLETSFEDTVISIFVPLYAVYALGSLDTIFNPSASSPAINSGTYNYFAVFFWTAVISAIGKVGSFMSGSLMARFWQVPNPEELDLDVDEAMELERKTFVPLFKYVFLSGIVIGCFPLAWHLWTHEHRYWPSQAVLWIGMFAFFSLSAVPKIGFQALIQSLASSSESSDKIFGFVGTFVTLCDCVVFFGFAALFNYLGSFELALSISAGIIAFNGLLELLIGPCLILPPAKRRNVDNNGYATIN
jgi:hypothetical protein